MLRVSGSTNGPGRGGTQPPSNATDPRLDSAPRPGRPAITVAAPIGIDAPTLNVGRDADACELLHDRMLGELVMRYAAGERVLDLGRGVPRVTEWARQRAASLAVVDAIDLGRGDSIRLPFTDGAFSLVYCVRTLPHLGRDPETSERAARSALAEIGRVLQPGGVALVEFDNPLSLWGAVHGLRRPAKALEPGPMCIDSARGLTRFDTLALLVERLPPTLSVTRVHGLRIVAPVPTLLAIPLVGRILEGLEWALRDRPIFGRMGGHVVTVLRHGGPPQSTAAGVQAGGDDLLR